MDDRERASGLRRSADRVLGVPLLRLAGVIRGTGDLPTRVRHIGVMKLAAIGDTVLLSGPMMDLRASFPSARISFFAGGSNAGVAGLLEGVDDVARLPVNRPLTAAKRLRTAQLDVLIDFEPWSRISALLASVSGARFTVGYRTRGEHRHFAFDATADHRADCHELANQQRLTSAVTGERERSSPILRVPDLSDPGPELEAPYIVFHPYCGGYLGHLREWPEDRWVELAEALGSTIVVTGGPGDRSRAASLVGRIPGSVSLAGHGDIGTTALALRGATAVVAVNTGVMHLGAALGVPTVSLNGPTNGARWGPVGERVANVDSAYEDCGYLHLGFEYGDHRRDCMEGITVENVVSALRELLGPNALSSLNPGT